MSRRRAPTTGAHQLPESDVDNDDVEMRDRTEDVGSDPDVESELGDGGSHDMFQTITDLSTYLCSVEEEYGYLLICASHACRTSLAGC